MLLALVVCYNTGGDYYAVIACHQERGEEQELPRPVPLLLLLLFLLLLFAVDDLATNGENAGMPQYPGGKNFPGMFQTLINLMPPHRVFWEGFLGSGAVMRAKLPAEINIGTDTNNDALRTFRREAHVPHLRLYNRPFLEMARAYRWKGDELVYLDPPYLLSSRSQTRPIYGEHEMTYTEHVELLRFIKTLPCRVMISGYQSNLYSRELKRWRVETYRGQTRRGPATEHVWLNFREPVELHDYRYLGDNWRERERINKRKKRLRLKYANMAVLERHALMSVIEEFKEEEREGFLL